ncbi:MAG: DUF4416 family protein [Planctomycetaceae bacterium]|jgi:hypothetical protein|nr:DUF4416 family protein [Planctomycetaceae bacterium]
MGDVKKTQPVLLIIAVFTSIETAFDWGHAKVESQFGKIEIESEIFRFDQFTNYYSKSMGQILQKQFWACQKLIDPSALAEIKLMTNNWETEFQNKNKTNLQRPLNLDPGYVDLGKLILASTKDHAHRIYLSNGIFAETTLIYRQKKWESLPWSYPDYQSEYCQKFLCQCRTLLKSKRETYPCIRDETEI